MITLTGLGGGPVSYTKYWSNIHVTKSFIFTKSGLFRKMASLVPTIDTVFAKATTNPENLFEKVHQIQILEWDLSSLGIVLETCYTCFLQRVMSDWSTM